MKIVGMIVGHRSMVGKISMIGFFSTSANDLPVIWNKKEERNLHVSEKVYQMGSGLPRHVHASAHV
jgi:hypothetical protein